jgi:hypothetical protein
VKGEACGSYREGERCIQCFVGKSEGRRPRGRPRRRWEYTIRIDFKETGWEGLDWNDLAHDRDRWLAVLNSVMNFGLPYNSGNFLTS